MAPCPNVRRPISFKFAHAVLGVSVDQKGGFAGSILERINMNITLDESDLEDDAERGNYPDS